MEGRTLRGECGFWGRTWRGLLEMPILLYIYIYLSCFCASWGGWRWGWQWGCDPQNAHAPKTCSAILEIAHGCTWGLVAWRGSPISVDSECLESRPRLYWPRFNGELRIDSLFALSSDTLYFLRPTAILWFQSSWQHVLLMADAETSLFTYVGW